jgi:hypothetical protein
MSLDSGMRGHPQKLVDDGPRRVPGAHPSLLTLEPFVAWGVKIGVNVGCVHEYVGIDEKH